MTYFMALLMGIVSSINYKDVRMSGFRLGWGYGSPLSKFFAYAGLLSLWVCVVPAAIYVGYNFGVISGILFFALTLIGSAISSLIAIPFIVARFISVMAIFINIVFMMTVITY